MAVFHQVTLIIVQLERLALVLERQIIDKQAYHGVALSVLYTIST
jgi:hypothetical protein